MITKHIDCNTSRYYYVIMLQTRSCAVTVDTSFLLVTAALIFFKDRSGS